MIWGFSGEGTCVCVVCLVCLVCLVFVGGGGSSLSLPKEVRGTIQDFDKLLEVQPRLRRREELPDQRAQLHRGDLHGQRGLHGLGELLHADPSVGGALREHPERVQQHGVLHQELLPEKAEDSLIFRGQRGGIHPLLEDRGSCPFAGRDCPRRINFQLGNVRLRMDLPHEFVVIDDPVSIDIKIADQRRKLSRSHGEVQLLADRPQLTQADHPIVVAIQGTEGVRGPREPHRDVLPQPLQHRVHLRNGGLLGDAFQQANRLLVGHVQDEDMAVDVHLSPHKEVQCLVVRCALGQSGVARDGLLHPLRLQKLPRDSATVLSGLLVNSHGVVGQEVHQQHSTARLVFQVTTKPEHPVSKVRRAVLRRLQYERVPAGQRVLLGAEAHVRWRAPPGNPLGGQRDIEGGEVGHSVFAAVVLLGEAVTVVDQHLSTHEADSPSNRKVSLRDVLLGSGGHRLQVGVRLGSAGLGHSLALDEDREGIVARVLPLHLNHF
eukprot:RCo038342